MPVTVHEDTELVVHGPRGDGARLAVAQSLRTRWIRPFDAGRLSPETGPWAGRELVGLHRSTSLLDRVGVAETPFGPLTVRVLGNTEPSSRRASRCCRGRGSPCRAICCRSENDCADLYGDEDGDGDE
ncbi:hypothetical protein ABZT27_32340 [Streptomyces sp. NPDC005389]|uniref:hypothetical protein n=1 Tax=Streptomyces sp. NPDC005389 TaxID=3157040 RepID=UPI0033AAB253